MDDIPAGFWDELTGLHDAMDQVRQPGEYGIAEYARANGMEYHRAQAELDKLEKDGKVKFLSVRRKIGKYLCKVFVKVSDPARPEA